jgi:hypothetical protein
MLIKEVSQNYFKNALSSVHATRLNSLFKACWSLVKQADLTIASLGRHLEGPAYVKHKIKSIDRLIGNSHLHRELPTIYKDFYRPFIACMSTLYIIVDWTGCCSQDTHMLRASLVRDGRSITIYNEIHSVKMLGNAIVHHHFLQALKKQIPPDKKVVVITDAGFVTPWFKAVRKLGWDYLGRIKGNVKILFDDHQRWMQVKTLHKGAKAHGHYIGKAILGKKSSTPVQGYVYRYKQKSDKKIKRNDRSRFPDINKRYSLTNRTPWILATSLKNYGKQFIKGIYSFRMQIEQTFRDDKNPRFGFGWRLSGSKCIKRINVLCLIANLAAFLLLSIGVLAEAQGEHRKYQVNTMRKKRVLSLLSLAKQALHHGCSIALTKAYAIATTELINSSARLYGA